jgi:hypothetical protein
MKTTILSIVALLISTLSIAQTTVRGRVIDANSGNGLIGASVYLEDFNEGAFTDFDGFFQFKTNAHGQTNLVFLFAINCFLSCIFRHYKHHT